LQVVVEEAAIEICWVIVVMMHIAARPPRQVDDLRKAGELLEASLQTAASGVGG
jgi:hypothetical protein